MQRTAGYMVAVPVRVTVCECGNFRVARSIRMARIEFRWRVGFLRFQNRARCRLQQIRGWVISGWVSSLSFCTRWQTLLHDASWAAPCSMAVFLCHMGQTVCPRFWIDLDWLVLVCCERKTLLTGWIRLAETNKQTGWKISVRVQTNHAWVGWYNINFTYFSE